VIDLGRADRIARINDARLYRPPCPIPQTYSKRRIQALSAYMQASGLPCEFTRKYARHRDYKWIVCTPHATTPEGVVYADLYTTRDEHRERVREVPNEKWWRCQGFMAVTGAPICDYITIYPLSDEEARAERGQSSWGAHNRAWKQRKTFYHIHRVKRDEEAIAHLLKQCIDIRERAGDGKEKRRPSADQVRAQFVPGRRPTGGPRKTYRPRRPGGSESSLSRGSREGLGDARVADLGEGQD
jgi:hypothetical protein